MEAKGKEGGKGREGRGENRPKSTSDSQFHVKAPRRSRCPRAQHRKGGGSTSKRGLWPSQPCTASRFMDTGGKPRSKPGSWGLHQLPKPCDNKSHERTPKAAPRQWRTHLVPRFITPNTLRVLSGGEWATGASDFSEAVP